MKAIVKNTVITWKHKLATALKKDTSAAYIRTEVVDTEAKAWSTCLLSRGHGTTPDTGVFGEEAEQGVAGVQSDLDGLDIL